jgi:hypothetical protein
MTMNQFNALPELVRRREVLALGIDEKLLDVVARIVDSAAEVPALPPRTIAAIRPTRNDGKRARLFYFTRTLSAFVTTK